MSWYSCWVGLRSSRMLMIDLSMDSKVAEWDLWEERCWVLWGEGSIGCWYVLVGVLSYFLIELSSLCFNLLGYWSSLWRIVKSWLKVFFGVAYCSGTFVIYISISFSLTGYLYLFLSWLIFFMYGCSSSSILFLCGIWNAFYSWTRGETVVLDGIEGACRESLIWESPRSLLSVFRPTCLFSLCGFIIKTYYGDRSN